MDSNLKMSTLHDFKSLKFSLAILSYLSYLVGAELWLIQITNKNLIWLSIIRLLIRCENWENGQLLGNYFENFSAVITEYDVASLSAR